MSTFERRGEESPLITLGHTVKVGLDATIFHPPLSRRWSLLPSVLAYDHPTKQVIQKKPKHLRRRPKDIEERREVAYKILPKLLRGEIKKPPLGRHMRYLHYHGKHKFHENPNWKKVDERILSGEFKTKVYEWHKYSRLIYFSIKSHLLVFIPVEFNNKLLPPDYKLSGVGSLGAVVGATYDGNIVIQPLNNTKTTYKTINKTLSEIVFPSNAKKSPLIQYAPIVPEHHLYTYKTDTLPLITAQELWPEKYTISNDPALSLTERLCETSTGKPLESMQVFAKEFAFVFKNPKPHKMLWLYLAWRLFADDAIPDDLSLLPTNILRYIDRGFLQRNDLQPWTEGDIKRAPFIYHDKSEKFTIKTKSTCVTP
jgi:hypothetical protein